MDASLSTTNMNTIEKQKVRERERDYTFLVLGKAYEQKCISL